MSDSDNDSPLPIKKTYKLESIKIQENNDEKSDKYKNERREILKKINNILNVNNDNNTIFLCDLNTVKQKQIEELEEEIKRVFSCRNTRLYDSKSLKKKYLTIIKLVYKQMDYKLIPSKTKKTIYRDGVSIMTYIYTLEKE